MSKETDHRGRIEAAYEAWVEAKREDPAMNVAYFLTQVDEEIRDEVGQEIADRRAARHIFRGGVRLAAGEVVGGYTLVAPMGRGASGAVWEAEDPELKRRGRLPMDRARFGLEAEAGARLTHPNIVRIYARGEAGDALWIAQELVSTADSMAAFISEKRDQVCPRPKQYFEAVARVVAAVAEAMDHAHRNGVIHRDLKPANILLTKGYRPKVVDFGVAQVAEESDRCDPYELVGTLYYMSPEQLNASLPVDHRTDIFSLGATLYEALTLVKPFHGGEKAEITRRITYSTPRDPRRVRATVPPELAAVCMKCLEKDPDRRYGSMRELADELHRFLEGKPVAARRPSAFRRALARVRREPGRLAVGALTVAIAAAAGWLARGLG